MASSNGGWPSRLGPDPNCPGYAPVDGPVSLNYKKGEPVGQSFPWLANNQCGRIDMIPVIDEKGHVFITSGVSFQKWSPDGFVMECDFEHGSICTAAIRSGKIFMVDADANAYCYFCSSLQVQWKTKFCEGVNGDGSSIGASKDIVICPGKANAAMSLNDTVYGLGPDSGLVKWKTSFSAAYICFLPTVLPDAVVFADMQGKVYSMKPKDGTQIWAQKHELGSRTTGAAVATADGWVYQTCNRKGKKAWNAPFGGKGKVRALALKTGDVKWEADCDLECNSAPSVLPYGAGKKLVVVGCGASPGTVAGEDKSLWAGDAFALQVIAWDATTGAVVWKYPPEPLIHPLPVVAGWKPGNEMQSTAWTSALGTRDGSLFIGNCSGNLVHLKTATGEEVEVFTPNSNPVAAFTAMPVAVQGAFYAGTPFLPFYSWRTDSFKPGKILQELVQPFEQTGHDHFWPCKAGRQDHTCVSKSVGPTDISKPAWSFECLDRNLGDFFYNTAVIDSQRNIWVSSNFRDLYCLRPDGSVRGSIYLGSLVRTPVFVGRFGYTANHPGYAIKFDIESLEYVWCVQYCKHVNADSWSCSATEERLILTGSLNNVDGGEYLWCLSTVDGSELWRFQVGQGQGQGPGGYIYNCMAAIVDDRVLTCVQAGYVYCLRLSDGQCLWEATGSTPQLFCTGHLWVAPNGYVYCMAHVPKGEPRSPDAETAMRALWNASCSQTMGHSVLRCWDIKSGALQWRKDFDIELQVTGVTIPKKGGASQGYICVIPLGNNTGCPGDQAYGDYWEARLVGLDAETGELLWSFTPPPGRFGSFPGNGFGDVYLPDSWGSLSADSLGTVYGGFGNGFFYCVDGHTGRLLSEYDMKNTCNCACAIAPGMVVMMAALRIYCFRDRKLEAEWLEAAGKEGDPRAFAIEQSERAPPPAEAHRGFLHDVAKDAFNCEDLRRFEWSDWFFKLEPNRRKAEEATVEFTVERKIAEEKERRAAGNFSGQDQASAAPAAATPQTQAPAPPKAATQDKEKEASQQLWEVVGGGKAGGIMVRKGESIKSDEHEQGRLSHGAKVKEKALKGERLHYEKVSGDGPDSGWISLSLKGNVLVKKI